MRLPKTNNRYSNTILQHCFHPNRCTFPVVVHFESTAPKTQPKNHMRVSSPLLFRKEDLGGTTNALLHYHLVEVSNLRQEKFWPSFCISLCLVCLLCLSRIIQICRFTSLSKTRHTAVTLPKQPTSSATRVDY